MKKETLHKNVYRVFVSRVGTCSRTAFLSAAIHSLLPINTVRDFSPETGGQHNLTKAIYFFECKRILALTTVVYLGFRNGTFIPIRN
jgi:hypothetical protein